DKIHHAYLFVGSRGTGKTSMAKILAASLNCERGGPTLTPCGECESCRSIAAGNSVDVIEMDAASNRSVDDIRSLRDRVAFAPASGRWKVYILDEAHMLTKEAWNAFLKTLEEPPPNTVFILATTEAHKVMPTIADRCQRFDFQRPSIEQLSEVISRVAVAETITIDPAAVSMVARAASGSFRDALGTLDQLVAYTGKQVALDDVLELLGAADAEILFGVVDAIVAADPRGVLNAVEQVARTGQDPARFARELLGHLRVLLVTQTTGEIPEAFAVTASDATRLRSQSAAIGPANLIRTIDELAAGLGAIREGDEARLAVEVALIKSARPDFDPSTEGMMRRLERLEQPGPPAPAQAQVPPAQAPPAPASAAPAPEPSVQTTSAPTPSAQPATTPDPPAAASPVPAPAAPDLEEPPLPEEPGAMPAPGPPSGSEPGQSSSATGPEPGPTVAASVVGGPDELAEEGVPTAIAQAKPAEAATPAAGDPVEPERLARVWPAVMDALRKAAPGPVASYFEGTRPVSSGQGRVEVGFAADAAFNRRNAEKPERRQKLVEAILAVTGERVELDFTTLDGGPAAEAGPATPAMTEEELVARVKTEFNAEEII
ncbi:MAG: DNA polymerase III subunit gamma/tau, partial [Actinomycetota bacterium]|nr:DNA polymerase III subunit gamma/tau [Actinomycetota bacterium]